MYYRSWLRFMNSSVNRALIFQGGGSVGAFEAGAYKAIKEELSQYRRAKGRGNEPMFHIVSGTIKRLIPLLGIRSYPEKISREYSRFSNV
jgi:hypothetical protein